MRNHEVTDSHPLLDDQGEIIEPGWARKQIWTYNRNSIRAQKMRIKEWDYYLVLHDGKAQGEKSFAAAFTISDDGYVGLQSCSILFLDKPCWEHTSTILNVFPMGKLHMPVSSSEGNVVYNDRKLSLTYRKAPGTREIRGVYTGFHEDKDLKVNVVLREPDMDTMVIATPWDRKYAFYYNQKINCMRASGTIAYGGEVFTLDPERDFGTLDWGRGVWTYDNTWYWGSGNQVINGHDFGFNIGYGFGNTKAATENVIFYNGKAHKLDDLEIRIPGDVSLYDMDSPRYMEPWTIHEESGRFEMTFLPVLDRSAKMDFKFIVSDQHQVFGRMSGKAVLDDGQEITVKDLLCFIEKVHNKY